MSAFPTPCGVQPSSFRILLPGRTEIVVVGDGSEVKSGQLIIKRGSEVFSIWNLSKIEGVIMEKVRLGH